MSFNYHLTGPIPDFTHIPQLYSLSLSGIDLTGKIPNFSKLPNLQYLRLRNLKQVQLPKFTNLPELTELNIGFSGFSFDDILPNLTIPSDTFLIGTQNLHCSPNPVIIGAEQGKTITLDLMIDDTVTTNVYQWYKNDELITNAPNANTLEITNFQESDNGTYKAVITNPNAPDGSVVNSCEYRVAIALANDDVCNATLLTLGQANSGSFIGATVQENEPYAPGGNCEINWCDSTLLGSVWYKFVAPANEGVNIEISSPSEHSDTKIALYSGIDCTANNPFQNAILLDANDDKPGNCCDGSIIALACLNPDETYYIQVDQFEPGQDDFNITVNALESCDLPCDLMIDEDINIRQDSCDGDGGFISAKVISPSGQVFITELLDAAGNSIDTSDHGAFFGHILAGNYRLRVTSLDIVGCAIESDFIQVLATCEQDCADNLTIDTIEQELYHAQQTITSTATLSEGHTTTFKAGTSITLKSGFHAQGTFSALIEDCAETIMEEPPVAELRNTTPSVEPVLAVPEINLMVYPNPFSQSTTIAYELPIAGEIHLQVLDFTGKQITILEQGTNKEIGRYEVTFQANDLANGTYFVVLQSAEYVEVKKLMLLSN